MPQTMLPGSLLAMTGQTADRLIQLDSGDAALLYLYLLRRGDLRGLGWPELLSGSAARKTAMTAMQMTVPRATSMVCLEVSLMPNTSWSRFSEKAEAAASSWESAVDMVAARIPARMHPATTAGRMP